MEDGDRMPPAGMPESAWVIGWASVIVAAGVVAFVADLVWPARVPGFIDSGASRPYEWVESATWALLPLAFFATGLAIVHRRRRNSIGRLLVVAAVTTMAGVIVNVAASHVAAAGWVDAAGVIDGVAAGLLTVWIPLLIGVVVVFPRGTVPSPGWRWLIGLIGLWLVVGVLASLFNGGWAGDVEDVTFPNPLRDAFHPVGDVLSGAWRLLAFASVVGAAAAVITRFRRSAGRERLQLKWLAWSSTIVAITISVILIVNPSPSTDTPLASVLVGVAFVLLPISIAVAVVQYRLYDIDRLVSRTLTYGIVIAGIGTLFAATVALPISALGGEGSPLLVAGGTLLMAAAFNPSRRWVQERVDRRFNRSRHDAQSVLEEFGDVVHDELDLTALTQRLAGAVDAMFEPATASVWVSSFEQTGSTSAEGSRTVVFPT